MSNDVQPTVSKHGTVRTDLIRQQLAIREAAERLIDALRAAPPRSRDYNSATGDYQKATAEHRRQCASVMQIRDAAAYTLEHLRTNGQNR